MEDEKILEDIYIRVEETSKMKQKTKIFLFICLFPFFSIQAKTPGDVYEYQFKSLLPKIEGILRSKNKDYQKIELKKVKNAHLKPNDVYILLRENYKALKGKISLPKITFKQPKDITPADVLKLSKKISKVLESKSYKNNSKKENISSYESWKTTSRNNGKSIIPGDVFYLNVYMRSLITLL